MKKVVSATLLLISLAGCRMAGTHDKSTDNQHLSKPKLVVGIVIDQMRYDYLYRYWNKYGDNGFKRLVKGGFSCENHHFNYMPTYTGPGHASIYTGTTPAVHGIIANDWYDFETGNLEYCVQDNSVQTVGVDNPATTEVGNKSPHRLLVSGMGDQIKLATNFKGKSIGVSLKDRAAILPAGNMADAAYWFSGGNDGIFVSSTYYMTELPGWAREFNENGLAVKYSESVWETMYPVETYTESRPDDSKYEGTFKGKNKPVFPYDIAAISGDKKFSLLKYTPFGNNLVAAFAKAAIAGEQLGQDSITDFLAVSFSSTDYAGHLWGPRSVEVEDMYLRLDTTLAAFLDYLDKTVGKGNYLLFLTADHGAAINPWEMADHGENTGHFDFSEIERAVRENLIRKFGGDDILLAFENGQFFLDRKLIRQHAIDVKQVDRMIVETCMEFPYIQTALTRNDLMFKQYDARPASLVQKGWHPQRSGDVALVFKPGWLSGAYGKTGTSHGSPWVYDTHVPLLFYGRGIEPGSTAETSYVDDIAPTVLTMLHIQMPTGCTGAPIDDVVED